MSAETAESIYDCPSDCHQHGVCDEGKCICDVSWTGHDCAEISIKYFATFGTMFSVFAAVAGAQLYYRVKQEGWSVTTEKMLLLFVSLAGFARGLYFSLQDFLPELASKQLFDIFYPLMMSSFALVICFWAEFYHLQQQRQGPFLSRSKNHFYFFLLFVYFVEVTKWGASWIVDQDTLSYIYDSYLAALYTCCIAGFVIYGMELFFKIRDSTEEQQKIPVTQTLFLSRVGIAIMALFQLCFLTLLITDIVFKVSNNRLPDFTVFLTRTVELCLIVWFSCALWHPRGKERLWILNPLLFSTPSLLINKEEEPQDEMRDCWICFENDAIKNLIHPCLCRGSVQYVHADCLKKWLISQDPTCNPTSYGTFNAVPKCKVCLVEYQITKRTSLGLLDYAQRLGWRGVGTILSFITMIAICFRCYSILSALLGGSMLGQALLGFALLVNEAVLFILLFRSLSNILIEAEQRELGVSNYSEATEQGAADPG
eukprot:TRINITY_DN6376_c0_g2_i3.p1 TRINITY_DN6376_c0_g2~~TRINITY_DN6376_c0_g2_i3.p1  ORF type:complete len:484 (-),score=84.21 TRINITY_DN6376_c0_g2_i3:52-1503(-)